MQQQANNAQKAQSYKIAQLQPGLTQLQKSTPTSIVFIVLEQQPAVKTKENVIDNFLIADETACIMLRLWDNDVNLPALKMQPGEIFRLTGGYCSLWKGSLGLYVGRKGKLERIGEFSMLFNESKNMSTVEWIEEPLQKRWIMKNGPNKV